MMATALLACEDNHVTSPSRAGARAEAPASPVVAGQSGAITSESVPAEGKVPDATAGRKIIYNARIDLVTEDLGKLDAALARLIESRKGYIADSERTGAAGATRQGTWKVRVPVASYDAFVKAAVALGELISIKADSQDVSEEYFDLEVRQATKKVEEGRLLKHLEVSTGKLEEILAVERELSRVRGEIERMQGRLRFLANLTDLATVTVAASEIKGYEPPQAPTLTTRVARTFARSLEALRAFAEAVLLCLVAIAPWLPLLLALGLGILLIRKARARPRG